MHFASPLRYPGGKSSIFNFVSKMLDENSLVRSSYAEPYAGGAGLALKLLYAGRVSHIYINDFDRAIYAFWKVATERSDALSTWIDEVEISMENWYEYREVYRNYSSSTTDFDLAKATFFLNRTNVSGVIKGGVIGGYQQNGKYKIDARFNRKSLIERIQKISDFSKFITVTNLDGLEFIKSMDEKDEDVFIYLDPPYYQKGADLYMNFFNPKNHEELSRHVHSIKKNWMVSYDNHDFILNLYASKNKVTYKLAQSASNRVGDEILVFSDALNYSESMKTLVNAVVI